MQWKTIVELPVPSGFWLDHDNLVLTFTNADLTKICPARYSSLINSSELSHLANKSIFKIFLLRATLKRTFQRDCYTY
jgi:hypothetical protein